MFWLCTATLILFLPAYKCFCSGRKSLFCTLPLFFSTSRLLKILSSPSPYLFHHSLSLVMSGQKQKRRESGFPLRAHSSTEASTGRSTIWYIHKPQGVQLEHWCLWLLRAVTKKEQCFKTFNTESADCKVVAYFQWPLAEISHFAHASFSWFGHRVNILCAYSVAFNTYWHMDQNRQQYFNRLQNKLVRNALSSNSKHHHLTISWK